MVKSVLSLCLTVVGVLSAVASQPTLPTLKSLINALRAIEQYDAEVEYTVTMPASYDDIVYSIGLHQRQVDGDSIAMPSYLIDWRVETPSGELSGFNAYDRGNHFRYRDGRLQEYHVDWDSLPFITGRGVHREAQFVDLLPAELADKIALIAADTVNYEVCYSPGARRGGDRVAVVEARQHYNDMTVRLMTMIFDAHDARPVALDYENNRGMISEQTVSARYKPVDVSYRVTRYDEEGLIERYPELFERYRVSNYRVENLAGLPLPALSLPTPTGERYSRDKGARMAAQTVIVMLDPAVATAAETVDMTRRAIDSLPMNVELIIACTGHDIDLIESATGTMRPGETILMSAASLGRDLGVTAWPTLIFVGRDGVITDTQIGFNNQLDKIVIQKSMIP